MTSVPPDCGPLMGIIGGLPSRGDCVFVFQREEGGYTNNDIELQISGTEHILCSILNAYNYIA